MKPSLTERNCLKAFIEVVYNTHRESLLQLHAQHDGLTADLHLENPRRHATYTASPGYTNLLLLFSTWLMGCNIRLVVGMYIQYFGHTIPAVSAHGMHIPGVLRAPCHPAH